MIKRQSAFSLVELMVVVGIMMIMTTLGIASYINTQDRTRVSNTGKELLAYFRKLQSYAKVGDRGPQTGGGFTNNCYPVGTDAQEGNKKLERWQADLHPRSGSTAPYATSKIICYDKKKTSTGGKEAPMPDTGQKYTYRFPNIGGLNLSACKINSGGSPPTGSCTTSPIDCVIFESVFGETSVGVSSESPNLCSGTFLFDVGSSTTTRNRDARFIVDDGQFGYTFLLTKGAFSTGCVCDPTTSGLDDSCKSISC